ncbi:MAG: hypothetical protein AB7P49_00275 [Bdellovibrionales bacterium]
MSKSYLTTCPRCGSRSFEYLPTHSHCFECLYSPDLNDPPAQPRFMTLREAEELLDAAGVRELPHLTAKVPEVAS